MTILVLKFAALAILLFVAYMAAIFYSGNKITLKHVLKFAAMVILLFVAYMAAIFYSTYRVATYLSECTSLESFCELAKKKASNQEVTSAMAKAFSCAKNRQSPVEEFFVPIPKNFSNPPPESVSYRDAEKNCNSK
jgi:hypothetical protein